MISKIVSDICISPMRVYLPYARARRVYIRDRSNKHDILDRHDNINDMI